MPAPTQTSIADFIKNAFLNHALDEPTRPVFVKQTLDSNNHPIALQPLQLTDDIVRMVDYFSEGISNQWSEWQANQSVVTTGVTTGVGSTTTPAPVALP